MVCSVHLGDTLVIIYGVVTTIVGLGEIIATVYARRHRVNSGRIPVGSYLIVKIVTEKSKPTQKDSLCHSSATNLNQKIS